MAITQKQTQEETQRYFQKVYLWMFIGLWISGIVSFYVANNPAALRIVFYSGWTFFGLLVFELALVMGLVWLINRISARVATLMFILYCFTTGLTLSVIFLSFTVKSIGLTFFIAASMFGIMSIIGYCTKADLTKMGQVLIMCLFGIILALILNFILKSNELDYIVSFIGVVVFAGLTAYDTQKLKMINKIGNEGTDEDKKEAILGALTLYLDFINLFLMLLRFLGRRK